MSRKKHWETLEECLINKRPFHVDFRENQLVDVRRILKQYGEPHEEELLKVNMVWIFSNSKSTKGSVYIPLKEVKAFGKYASQWDRIVDLIKNKKSFRMKLTKAEFNAIVDYCNANRAAQTPRKFKNKDMSGSVVQFPVSFTYGYGRGEFGKCYNLKVLANKIPSCDFKGVPFIPLILEDIPDEHKDLTKPLPVEEAVGRDKQKIGDLKKTLTSKEESIEKMVEDIRIQKCNIEERDVIISDRDRKIGGLESQLQTCNLIYNTIVKHPVLEKDALKPEDGLELKIGQLITKLDLNYHLNKNAAMVLEEIYKECNKVVLISADCSAKEAVDFLATLAQKRAAEIHDLNQVVVAQAKDKYVPKTGSTFQ